jgi:hypothetical protein
LARNKQIRRCCIERGIMSTTEQTPVCKHFKLHLLLVIEWVDIRSKRNGKRGPYRGGAMESRMNQGPRGSVNSGRFEALLDKLVAVQMDLEPVCGVSTARAQVVASLAAIAEACSVLRSAIADVRSIIHQADGLMDLPEAVPASD